MQNGDIEVEPVPLNYRRPTEMFSKDNMRKLSRVSVSRADMKILLLSSVKHHLVVKRLAQAGHVCDVVHDIKEGLQLISANHHQVMVVDVISSDISLDEAANELHSRPFSDGVVLIALVKSVDLSNREKMKRIAQLGYTRVITNIDFLESELVFVENNELALRNRLIFAEALFEATEYCSDGVEITSVSPEFRLVYTNKSYSDMVHEEEDMTKQFLEGESRRKHSRQIIPIHNSFQEMAYQVTVRPSFHLDGGHHFHSRTSSLSSRHGKGSLGSLSQTRAVVETPIMKVINMLQIAQNTDECSVEIRDTLENTMEILRKVPDIYSPNLEENEPASQAPGTGGGGFMYRGLLRNPRRQSQNFDSLPRGTSLYSPHHTNKVACLVTPSQIRKTLENIKTWRYNIMELEAVSFNQPLYYLGMEVFTRWFKVDEYLCVDETVIGSWLQLMESKYNSSNTYHNSTHAADVLQAGAYFLQKLIDRGDSWEPLERASILIAMVVHDLDHPGRTNNFLTNSRHELSILYNDKSILENHHVATAFKETSNSSTGNIFKSLDTESYQSIRQNIVEMVLATDMSKHFEHLSKFTTGVTSQTSDFPSASNTSLDKDQIETDLLVKRILVKSADLANPARPMPLCKEWAARISTEYFSQTEEEKRLGLPVVMPAFDRNTCNFPQTQVQFIDFIVTGLFEAWNNFVDISEVIGELESNYKFWKDASSTSPTTEV